MAPGPQQGPRLWGECLAQKEKKKKTTKSTKALFLQAQINCFNQKVYKTIGNTYLLIEKIDLGS